MPRAKKQSPGEAAAQELQDKPAEVARQETEHAADGAAPAKKPGRPKGSKNKPKAAKRSPGRPKGSKSTPKPAVKRLGRPPGSKNKPKVPSMARRGPGRPARSTGSGLGEINAVVESMVEQRTREVLQQALAALKQASAAVERAM